MINRRTAPGFAALLLALLICHGAQALSPEQRYRELDAKKAETNWITAKANADHFLGMSSESILALFGLPVEEQSARTEIAVDKNKKLSFAPAENCIVFTMEPVKPVKGLDRVGLISDSPHWLIRGTGATSRIDDFLWTGVKRKPEQEYWAIIKANLDHLIGMDVSQIESLLGPPRCSSEVDSVMLYRVGNTRLRFLFAEKKVAKFEFYADRYLPGT